jgi:hypothetical protein
VALGASSLDDARGLERGLPQPRSDLVIRSFEVRMPSSPKIVSLFLDSEGTPFLAAGSPHAYGPARTRLYRALRRDLSPLRIVRAPGSVRKHPGSGSTPQPEHCTPYVDANGLGLMLRPRLPLLFVKTRRGELLPDARTAIAYAREAGGEFNDALNVIAERAAEVLDPELVGRHRGDDPGLFRDLVQPYSCFSPEFFSIPAGFYVVTPPGVGTLIGAPINRPSALPVVTGLIETDWHHKELFVVTARPDFAGRSLLVLPETDLAQIHFVARTDADGVCVEHRVAGDPTRDAYQQEWTSLSDRLSVDGKGLVAVRRGVASVSLECLHCRVSVVRAADGDLPHDHEIATTFTPGYRTRKRQEQQRRATP